MNFFIVEFNFFNFSNRKLRKEKCQAKIKLHVMKCNENPYNKNYHIMKLHWCNNQLHHNHKQIFIFTFYRYFFKLLLFRGFRLRGGPILNPPAYAHGVTRNIGNGHQTAFKQCWTRRSISRLLLTHYLRCYWQNYRAFPEFFGIHSTSHKASCWNFVKIYSLLLKLWTKNPGSDWNEITCILTE